MLHKHQTRILLFTYITLYFIYSYKRVYIFCCQKCLEPKKKMSEYIRKIDCIMLAFDIYM